MGEIKGFWRRDANGAQNGESIAAIRVRNGASPDGDRLPVIHPDFEGNTRKSMRLRNGTFC